MPKGGMNPDQGMRRGEIGALGPPKVQHLQPARLIKISNRSESCVLFAHHMPRSECNLLDLSEIIFTELKDKQSSILTLIISLTGFASGQADRFPGKEPLQPTNLSTVSRG